MKAGEVVDLRDLERGKTGFEGEIEKVLLCAMWHKIPFPPPQKGFSKDLYCFIDSCVRCFHIKLDSVSFLCAVD